MYSIRLCLAVLAGLFCTSAYAAPDENEQEFVNRVNRAIEKGKKFLNEREGGKGNWDGILLEGLSDQVGGQTALATLAMLNCGVPHDDKVVGRALEFLRQLEPRKTYVVSLCNMVFAEARQPKDLNRVQKNTDWLLKQAIRRKGKIHGWSYPNSNTIPDASNTQYALLGLYAAKQAGVKIDQQVWAEIREMYITTQGKDGHWTYDYSSGVGPLSRPSFTMTTAGVCGLLIAGMGLNDSQQKLDEASGIAADCGKYSINEPLNRGMKWISERFDFVTVPGLKSAYYNVYGIERLGRLSGQRFIGKYDWYREGCDKLTNVQNDDGSWTKIADNTPGDAFPIVTTSFAMLFLSKGRTPILMTKFAFDGGLNEPAGITTWNRKQNDVRNLTEYASRELFKGLPLGWQVHDARKIDLSGGKLKAETESLLASPIIYFNGHTRPNFTGSQKDLLKKYVDEGGFLFAEACCGSEEFTREFRTLMRELFPGSAMVPMSPDHPVWRSFFDVSPADITGVEVMERGCKTVVVLCTKPLAGYWEENRFMVSKGTPATNKGQRAYQFAGNVIAYATGMQPPEQRGTKVAIVDSKLDLTPPRGALKPAQLEVGAFPAPMAMRNLMAHIKTTTGVETVLDKQAVRPNDTELDKYKFIYWHGRKSFALQSAEVQNIKDCLETGGLLLADSACGKPEFDTSFREFAKRIFPDSKLELIPVDDELYSEKINGTQMQIRTVQRREKTDGNGADGGFKELPPHLEGIKIDGRWVIIYSKFDIGCALERHKSTDCLGHSHESALKLGTAAVMYSLKR